MRIKRKGNSGPAGSHQLKTGQVRIPLPQQVLVSRARTQHGGTAVPPAAHGNAAREHDDARPVVVPHWRDCQPRRPARWVRHAPRRDAGMTMRPRSVDEGWRDGRLRTDPHGRPMRINMTYTNGFITSADFSPKIGQDVFGEGPFEGIYRSRLTADCDTVEFQFQIGEISWTTKDGGERSYTPDGGRITSDGREIWFEIKAHESYFQCPETADLLAQAELVLAEHGIELETVDGSKLLEDPERMRRVTEVLRFRNVPYDDADVAKAHALILQHDGRAPLGRITSILSNNRLRGAAMANAMLLRRDIGFHLDAAITPDTTVHIPLRPTRRLTRTDG